MPFDFSNIFPLGGQAANNRTLTEKEKAVTRERVDKTHFELSVALEKASLNVQRAILNVQNIDRARHPNQRDRKIAMQMLRMYVGQHRVVQTMVANMDMIKAEMTIREMTSEFSESMNAIGNLIQQYSAQSIGPGKLVRKLRGVIRPTQTQEALREYDRLYDELASMYTTEDDSDASGISTEWLERIVSGEADWQNDPIVGVQSQVATQTYAPQQVTPQQVAPQQVAPQQVAPQQAAPQQQSIPNVPQSTLDTMGYLKGILSDD